ncbi:MAG: hypothetical protein JJE03_00020 [Peptostreptococcaceae bacterium]|nr:hypothetical protein [Peptostreptococcaceae bacterium]
MIKTLVVLTKSRKDGDYCIACKDLKTGEWIRLIDNDINKHNSIKKSKFFNSEGKSINLLDVVRVDVRLPFNKNHSQPENWVLNNYKFEPNGRYKEYVLDKLEDNYDNIFYDNNRTIRKEIIEEKPKVYSLQLVTAEVLIIKINLNKEHRLKADIKYNGNWLSDIDITDEDFVNRHYDKVESENSLTLNCIKIVVSLAEEFNNRHFKLIAAIFDGNEYVSF